MTEAVLDQRDWNRVEDELGKVMPGASGPPHKLQAAERGAVPDSAIHSEKDSIELALEQIAEALAKDSFPAAD